MYAIFGFGLQLKSFNHTGRKIHLRTNADPFADTGDSHAPVPFYVSTKGYGVYIDTARYLTFYCGSSSKLSKGENELDENNAEVANNTEELYSVKKLCEAGIMLIEVPYVKGVDIYFFEGPDIRTAVQRYNLFSGGGCLPPLWGLGILYRTYSQADMNGVLDLARRIRKDSIPCDSIGIEPGWQSHSYSCSFAWDKERFQKPEWLIKELKTMGYHINLWEHAFIHSSSSLYELLKPYSGDYEVWKGLVPDLSIAKASDIFAQYHRKQFVENEIDSFKLDECDGSDFTGGWSFPNCSEFPSGMDGEQMHSLLGILYQKTILLAIESSHKRTFGQVRSSHAFAAHLPFVLYSDLYEHRDFIRGILNSGFSSLLWTPEVRQCTSVEDLIRRIQTVVFSPQACINAWMIPNLPWLQYDYEKNMKGQLLENYKEVTDMCRKQFELRMSFIPFLYSAFAKYYFEGIPPFRALVMDYSEDENTYNIDDQYMMGDSILVAPVVSGHNNKSVYLPAGNWYCFWTNKKFQGGQVYVIDVPLERIPLFIKEGSLIPLASSIEYITPDTRFEITVMCYGDECKDFSLFEDDGYTFDFKKGVYNLVKLKYSKDGIHIERYGNYIEKKYTIVDWKYIN